MTYERRMDAACCIAMAVFLLAAMWAQGLAERAI